MPFGRSSRIASVLHRLMALGSAALVIALTVFAASPELHEKLHSGGIGHGDDHCAIALFASGTTPGVGPITVEPPAVEFHAVAVITAEEVWLVCPRYLRQPERGPPGLR